MIKVFLKDSSYEGKCSEGTTIYDVFKEAGQVNNQLICAGKIGDKQDLDTLHHTGYSLDFNIR